MSRPIEPNKGALSVRARRTLLEKIHTAGEAIYWKVGGRAGIIAIRNEATGKSVGLSQLTDTELQTVLDAFLARDKQEVHS